MFIDTRQSLAEHHETPPIQIGGNLGYITLAPSLQSLLKAAAQAMAPTGSAYIHIDANPQEAAVTYHDPEGTPLTEKTVILCATTGDIVASGDELSLPPTWETEFEEYMDILAAQIQELDWLTN